jgi:alpha-beta hydrolase superfamily lysophospholipase
MKNRPLASLLITLSSLLLAGCASLAERERAWIFQPNQTSRNIGTQAAREMDEVWIEFESRVTGKTGRLHGLWLAARQDLSPDPQAGAKAPADAIKVQLPGQAEKAGPALAGSAGDQGPVLLYLHGARWDVTASSFRMRRMQELGFSVLGVDYRGFGKTSAELPSEEMAYEDARAAWNWLAERYPQRPRYIFGHSLGGPIAIHLAAEVSDESGTIVEGTFTSMAELVSSFRWGWAPVTALITQRFEAARKVDKIGSPLLVVHGLQDRLIAPALGRKLYDAAVEPKLLVLVEGGSHHNTNAMGQPQYKTALAQLFKLEPR